MRLLLLGAVDFHGDSVSAVQLLPDPATRTIDVPDLSRAFDPTAEPVWAWMTEPWPFAVPPESVAMTNLDVLRGKPVMYAARYEDGYWEMLADADSDPDPKNFRAAPLATLLAFDESLSPVVDLEVESGIHRDPPGPWSPWFAPGGSD